MRSSSSPITSSGIFNIGNRTDVSLLARAEGKTPTSDTGGAIGETGDPGLGDGSLKISVLMLREEKDEAEDIQSSTSGKSETKQR